MRSSDPSHLRLHQRWLKDGFLTAARGVVPPIIMHAVIAAVPLILSGCADQGYKMFGVTYEYTDQNRAASEQRALQKAQDECFFAGYEYAQPAGPAKIVSDGGTASGHFRATKFFYCIGMRGEG